jgi:hypothetical protein
MTNRRNWQMAFLKQARNDWAAYQRTLRPPWSACDRLHYLQMTTEKLGKALLLGSKVDFEVATSRHAAFVKFLRVVSNNYNLHSKLGLTRAQLQIYFSQFLPIAHEIEILAPALSQGGPNSEYPWADKSGRIYVPAEYEFPLTKLLQLPSGLHLIKFISIFLVDFEKLFLR